MAALQTYQRLTVPTIWVAFALSLALHALLLWGGRMPTPRVLPFDADKEGRPSGSIAIRIAPAPKPAPPAAPESRPQPPVPELKAPKAPATKPAPKSAPKPPPAPEVLAMQRPAERVAPKAPANDLAAYVEARRRAREAAEAQSRPPSPPATPQQPAETEEQREQRIRAANLGLDRAPGIGSSRERGGGVFTIARVTSDEAEFFFYGWNKDIQRNSPQMISVRRGSHSTIELAVVRRMIELIRERSSADFTFESKRLGRDVQLSARAADTGRLEAFLLQEFFSARPR